MKNTYSLLIICFILGINNFILAKEVPIHEAKEIALTAIKRNATGTLKNARNLRISEQYTQRLDNQPVYYAFNLQPTGFVIISAEDRYFPVLAFSEESHLQLNQLDHFVGLTGTLSRHEQRIDFLRKNNLPPHQKIAKDWQALRSKTTALPRNSGVVVAPLTTTRWNQGEFYNAECPTDEYAMQNGPAGRTYCGCAPVAMAQLIKFHNAPAYGTSSNTYEDPTYGTLSADFCATQYNWNNMPDELTAPNQDVATLIYHMGVATNTYYSPTYTSTYISYIRNAFVYYFGFDESANWFYDANNDFPWVARNDLDRGIPLLLSGVSVYGGAHTWVADGYGYFDVNGNDGDSEYFHFNWGWGGDNNGWFLDGGESWLHREDETQNVTITYYWDRYVIQNLFPDSEGCPAPESYYASGIEKNNAYLNIGSPVTEEEVAFRYRKTGDSQWIATSPTSNYFQLITNLEAGTEYEFQTKRKCCPDIWSRYSATATFSTPGSTPCSAPAASGMFTSSISDHAAYIYTSQPNGALDNQFRYRPIDTDEWSYTDVSSLYYRYLTNLMSGTTYEVQVQEDCGGDFSEYSASFTFTTTGEMEGEEGNNSSDCEAVNGDDLTTSSTTETYTYVYTPQPLGAVNNQFRYRPDNSQNWIETSISSSYFRFLADLTAGTNYEFQVRQECTPDSWSDYSASNYFTTSGTAPDEGGTDDNGESPEHSDCAPVQGSSLYFSSVSNQNAYIYTPQPQGITQNQFRYRPKGTTDWAVSDISTSYYRYLSGLSPNTTYEFQARQECTTDNWSEYSDSQEFTTTSTGRMSIPAPLSLEAISNHSAALNWRAFPNPVTNQLSINLASPLPASYNLTIWNVAGQLIYQSQGTINGSLTEQVSMSRLETGVYVVKIKTDKELQTTKIIKQ